MFAIIPGSHKRGSAMGKAQVAPSWLYLGFCNLLKFKWSKAPPSYSFSSAESVKGEHLGRLPIVLNNTPPNLTIFCRGSGSDAPEEDFANACTLLGV